MYMDSNIYIISVISFFLLFLIGLGFSIRYVIFYKYQYLITSIALCVLFFFISYMMVFFKFPKDYYPQNTNPCPDFWELQKDGTCLIGGAKKVNIGSMPTIKTDYFIPAGGNANNGEGTTYNKPDSSLTTANLTGYSLENIPFGYNIYNGTGTVDFTDVRWSTFNGAQSRNCALKAWANKNGIVWDGIHNYNKC